MRRGAWETPLAQVRTSLPEYSPKSAAVAHQPAIATAMMVATAPLLETSNSASAVITPVRAATPSAVSSPVRSSGRRWPARERGGTIVSGAGSTVAPSPTRLNDTCSTAPDAPPSASSSPPTTSSRAAG
jgi:hypothetical protein